MVFPPSPSLQQDHLRHAPCWRKLSRRSRLVGVVSAAVLAAVLLGLAKTPGIVLAVVVAGIILFVSHHDPAEPEVAQLLHSVQLSADDISATLADYDAYVRRDAQSYRQATGHTSPLLNPDSPDPDIAAFHQFRGVCERFVGALPEHLAAAREDRSGAEDLLELTDYRAEQLRSRWLRAQAAARRLHPHGG